MKEIKYTLKVSHKYQKEIYRIIEVSGNVTLDRLHKIILDAFGFDDDHLYMFSLIRKKYDKNGYYAPGSGGGGKSAARVKIAELGLKIRNKFLFLYDFGDEWEFDVAVSKITESETVGQKRVIESQGELEQYEYGDEGDNDGYPSVENGETAENTRLQIDDIKDLLDFSLQDERLQLRNTLTLPTNVLYKGDLYRVEKCEMNMETVLHDADPEDQVWLFQALNLKAPDDQGKYAKALADYYCQSPACFLEVLTAEDIAFLHWLFKKDYRGFLRKYYVPDSALHLQALGLMRVSAEDIYYIEIVEDIYGLETAVEKKLQEREIQKECEIEQIFMALIRLYSVVEKDRFRQLVSDCAQCEIDEVYFEELLVKQNLLWHRMICYKDADQNEYFTWFTEEESSQRVLENRAKCKVDAYKRFDRDYCIGLIREKAATTIWCKRLARDLFCYVRDSYLADCIVEDIENFARIGGDDQEFLDVVLHFFSEFEISWTKKIRDTLKKLHETYPSGGLKGHTWKEYNLTHVDGCSQISMFNLL